jgi:hypothetical protein
MTKRTREQHRAYMREYMRRRRRGLPGLADDRKRRPVVPPPAQYADLAAEIFGDPPIGRRAIDAERRP